MITKFLEYLKEQQNTPDIMVVCDVQKEFSEFINTGFVDALLDYCKGFNTVYQIWDSNKAKAPSYTFPNQKLAIVKKYGTKFSEELEETVEKLNAKYPNAKEGDIFEFDDINSYVIKITNNHGWFYIPEKMAELFNSLKGKNVILVGGAWTECIQDVFEAMEAFGIKVQYDKRYIYSAKTSNKQQYDIKTQSQLI
jgi:uncharacterized FlaG/YvyC family protein